MGRIGFIVDNLEQKNEKINQLFEYNYTGEETQEPQEPQEPQKKVSDVPAYTDNMSPEDEMKIFMSWFEVLKGYDKRLEMLEKGEKKTHTMLERMKGEETEITFSQLAGVGVVLFAITFSAVALALKVMA